MSLPFDGFKAAQTGLVDMGNISFYNNTGADARSSIVWELAQYKDQLQRDRAERHLGAGAGARRTRSTRRSSTARSSRSTSSTAPTTPTSASSSGCWGGFTAPDLGQGDQRRADHGDRPERGRSRLLRPPDDRPLLDRRLHQRLAEPAERARHQVRRHGDHPRRVADGRSLRPPTSPSCRCVRTRSYRPNPADGTVNQIAQLADGRLQRRRRDADACCARQSPTTIRWSTTPLDYTMNSFHLFDSGNELYDGNFTLAVLQQARNSARIVQAGNHALSDPLYSPDDRRLWPARQRRHGQAGGGQQQLPDSAPDRPGRLPGLAGRRQPGRHAECAATSSCGTSRPLPACPMASRLQRRSRWRSLAWTLAVPPAARRRTTQAPRTMARLLGLHRARRLSPARPAGSPSPAPMPCCSPSNT